jgi:hypothetical protein
VVGIGKITPIDVPIVNLVTAGCIEIPPAGPSIHHKKDVVIHLVCPLFGVRLWTGPSNVRSPAGLAGDKGVVIELSRPSVSRGRNVGRERAGFIYPRARGTVSSAEHEASAVSIRL